MFWSKLFFIGLLMVQNSYGAVTTLVPPTIIHTINSTDVGPEFEPIDAASGKTPIQKNSSSSVGEKPVEGM